MLRNPGGSHETATETYSENSFISRLFALILNASFAFWYRENKTPRNAVFPKSRNK